MLLVQLSLGSFADEHDAVSDGDGYLGDEVCAACHEALLAPWAETTHARVFKPVNARNERMRQGCEGCHGPGAAHVEAGGGRDGSMESFLGVATEELHASNAVCLSCHSGGKRTYWEGGAHESRDVACTSCHTIMKRVSPDHQLARRTEMQTCAGCHKVQRARQHRNAHMPVREGKISCSSCHNTHGTISDSLIDHVTVNDSCYSCHADKRGPFLWEHYPVNESCLNCHDPHGTTRDRMLKLALPRLCHQCHIETRHPTNPQDPDSRFVIGGSCLNCHPNIHGSNHPSGNRFTR